ncbi:MAG: hypothetical protein CMH88_16310 [Oceanibulbus sp.]|nr:hypothetical protein [Sulfitobacter sp.]HBC16625.1 hypothetical protein [Erythrobacter sp.]
MIGEVALPLLAGLLGFCLARANSCTVASVRRLVLERRWDWLLGLATAASAGAVTLVALLMIGGSGFALPDHHELGWGPVLGGLLLGTGAWINRACMLGSISRLAEGDTNFLLTLVGLAAALSAWPNLYILPEEPDSYRVGDLLSLTPAPVFAILALLTLGWAIFRLQRGRNAALLYLVAAGVLGATLFAGSPQWSYLSSIDRALRGSLFALGLGTDIAALTIFAGAWLSTWLASLFSWVKPSVTRATGCLLGGFLMGLGAQTVPGGNDALLLWTIPGAALYGLVAYAMMVVSIAFCLIVSNHFRRGAAAQHR